MTESEKLEITFLRQYAVELTEENIELKKKLKKARKEKKRFKHKYLELRKSL